MYIDHRQTDWTKWLPIAEFAFNNVKNRKIGQTLFFANTARHPTILPSSTASNVPAADDLTNTIVKVHEEVKVSLHMSQEMEGDLRADMTFEVGNMVWLSAKHVSTQRPSKKLDWKRLGPYRITESIWKVAFQLKLPKTMRIQNVFHVSLLSLHKLNTIPGQSFKEPPPVVTEEGKEEWEVKCILDSRKSHRQLQYLVKWVGYPPSEQSWEPTISLGNTQELTNEFHVVHPNTIHK